MKVSQLKAFLNQRDSSHAVPFILTLSPPTTPSFRHTLPLTAIKAEVNEDNIIDLITPPGSPNSKHRRIPSAVRTKTIHHNGDKVLEILDSDDKMDIDGDTGSTGVVDMVDVQVPSMPPATDWQDPTIESQVVSERTKLTRQLEVERIEYLSELPSVWPIPTVPTVYVVNLRDPKFHIVENNKVLTADGLIKNKVSF